MKINGIYLINDMPLDIVYIEWCKPSYKKMYEIINNYKELGYIVLIDRTRKNGDSELVYSPNSKYHFYIIKDYE